MPNPQCPVCLSSHVIKVRELEDGLNNPKVDLFLCVACRSASSPLATPVAPHSALGWHLDVASRNTQYALDLFQDIGIQQPVVLDIGCGSGTLIEAARSLGGGGVGFDLDGDSCAYGRSQGLDLRDEIWTPSICLSQTINLITCIMVLEHIHQPRPLLAQLIEAAGNHKCPLFISVPFFASSWWHYLSEDLDDESHPFRQPRVHVTHFSPDGFESAVMQLGASRYVSMIGRKGWPGYLVYSA